MMHRKAVLFLIVVLACSVLGVAQEGSVGDEGLNLTTDRSLGVGMQLDFPFGGLLSGLSPWQQFLDRMHGRVADILEWGTDGLKDHDMPAYVELIRRLQA